MTDGSQKGEHRIIRYFEEHHIRYLYREKKIDLPKEDAQHYLLPDFYLPDYKLYVDFLSGWDDPKQRPRLLGRIDRCAKYRIPCIFIYPKDLHQLDSILQKRLAELSIVEQDLEKQKQNLKFNNIAAICSLIIGGILTLFPFTQILGYIFLSFGIVLFLLCNHQHLGRGTTIFVTYLWLIIRSIGKGLIWGVLHLGTVFKYTGRGTAFFAANLGKGLKIAGICLWRVLRWILFWLFYLIRFILLMLWKYTKIAVKGLQILFHAVYKEAGKGARSTGTSTSRFLRGLKKMLIAIAVVIASLIMIPVDLFMQGPGKALQKKYREYKRKLEIRMQHRKFRP